MVNKWSKQKLGDVCEINQSKRDNNWKHPIIEYIDISSVGVGYLIDKPNLISIKEAPSRAQRLVQDGDTIVSTVRPNRRSMLYIKSPKQNTVVSTGFAVLHPKKIDPRFLYYTVFDQEFTDYLTARADGSAYPAVSPEVISDAELDLPPLPEQRAIAGILGALDDKIELNRRMNATLESIARVAFHQWFVEGEEVKGWEQTNLGEVVTIFDSKRVPLSGRVRAERQGQYPYYGAASVMDYIDDYLFDGIYVLMAEDGSVIDDNDHPVIQYVWGKFWVNNHAHVLQGANGICNEHLYLFLKELNIRPYITGAVQPKINQANMCSIPFVLPPQEICKKFEEVVSPLFAQIRLNTEESRMLASLRNGLLPRLMRGEVRVKDLDITMSFKMAN